jgi:hypothetical protein
MEKLLIATMKNPTPENKKKLLAYEAKHSFAICFLSKEQVTILNQYRREA